MALIPKQGRKSAKRTVSSIVVMLMHLLGKLIGNLGGINVVRVGGEGAP